MSGQSKLTRVLAGLVLAAGLGFAGLAAAEQSAPLVSLSADGAFALNGDRMSDAELVAELQQVRAAGYHGQVLLSAYPDVSSSEIIRALNIIQDGGFSEISLRPQQGAPAEPAPAPQQGE